MRLQIAEGAAGTTTCRPSDRSNRSRSPAAAHAAASAPCPHKSARAHHAGVLVAEQPIKGLAWCLDALGAGRRARRARHRSGSIAAPQSAPQPNVTVLPRAARASAPMNHTGASAILGWRAWSSVLYRFSHLEDCAMRALVSSPITVNWLILIWKSGVPQTLTPVFRNNI